MIQPAWDATIAYTASPTKATAIALRMRDEMSQIISSGLCMMNMIFKIRGEDLFDT
jgi:hypothetical protein